MEQSKPPHEPKFRKDANYRSLRPELLKLFTLRASLEEIAKKLEISESTAQRYRARLVHELGSIQVDNLKQHQEEYLAKTFRDLAMIEQAMIPELLKDDNKSKYNAVNAIITTKRLELELMSRFGIVPADRSEQKIEMSTKPQLSELMAALKEAKKKRTGQ